MAKRKKGLTLDEHKQLGLELFHMHERLVSIAVLLGNRYPKKTKLYDLTDRTEQALSKLRSKLDDIVCEEFPHNECIKIYYPGSKLRQMTQKRAKLSI